VTPLRRLALALLAFTALSALAAVPAQAAPEFGIESFASAISKDQAETEPATQAGSHPEALTVKAFFNHEVTLEEEQCELNFIETECVPEQEPAIYANIYGSPRRLLVNLPVGLAVDPAATSVRCTTTQLQIETHGGAGCPDASAVGFIHGVAGNYIGEHLHGGLYNMVPPPGVPAEFAANLNGLGFVVTIYGHLRSGADYGLSGSTAEISQLVPVFGFKLWLFGDPSSPSRDSQRGACGSSWTVSGVLQAIEREFIENGNDREAYAVDCPLAPAETTETPFLTMPTACSGAPLSTTMSVDTWQQPGTAVEPPPSTSPALTGCEGLHFEPEIEARPTTNVADSPSGLNFDLKLPQPENVNTLSEAHLKDAVVTLPKGIAIDPSVANGLATCTTAQIGYKPGTTEPFEFSAEAPNCPDASKVGSVEVKSPLLTEVNPDGTVPTDAEGNPIAETLPGAVYLAAQGDNPFHSLMAIYIVVNDPERGIVVKLAGHVVPDPETGQLVTTVEESPQVPIEEFQLHFFGGSRAPLRTPAVCGNYETTTELTPWSAPESGPPATPADHYAIATAPGGGPCPTSAAQLPNKPHFSAGTLSPTAGAFSPFVLKLSREDGSQELHGLNATLPPGLTGKLAGIPYCPQSAIDQAKARSHEGQGALEKSSPSCPAASEVGTVDVGAGAGPNPIHVSGHAYLAGPYKGAPLSMVIVTPALAGPFDLGTVVVRAALYVNPETAQITVKSDQIPTILDGIPLDVKSIAVNVSRNQFTLNPTSCNPFSIAATAFAASSEAALSSHFQVGGCDGLGFRPKLTIALKGSVKRTANPALTATLTQPPGQANIARAQVKLPRAAFLDNAHIGAVCTRVQFAAHSCPSASVYGTAEATTPLLDYPLKGTVYLRSNPEHELPDLLVGFTGPATQPIEFALAGRTDSVKGALRNSFEAVPDVPVSSFRLSLFGGKKGLVEMSSGFCRSPRATVNLTAQNGKVYDTTPKVAAKCPNPKKHKNRRGQR
jgi:hypothetical protein